MAYDANTTRLVVQETVGTKKVLVVYVPGDRRTLPLAARAKIREAFGHDDFVVRPFSPDLDRATLVDNRWGGMPS